MQPTTSFEILRRHFPSCGCSLGLFFGGLRPKKRFPVEPRCQSFIISDIRPLALKFPMAHSTTFWAQYLKFERNMASQYFWPSPSKISGKRTVASSRTKKCHHSPTPAISLGTSSASTIFLAAASRQGCCLRLIACFPGEGLTRRTPRSSSGSSCFVSTLDHLCLYQAHRPRAPLLLLRCLYVFPWRARGR